MGEGKVPARDGPSSPSVEAAHPLNTAGPSFVEETEDYASSAGPGAASGRRRPAPALLTAQTHAAAGRDPGPGLGRLGIDGAGVSSNGGPIGQIHLSVGYDLLILSGDCPTLSEVTRIVRVTSIGPGLPPGPDQHRPQTGAPSRMGWWA